MQAAYTAQRAGGALPAYSGLTFEMSGIHATVNDRRKWEDFSWYVVTSASKETFL